MIGASQSTCKFVGLEKMPLIYFLLYRHECYTGNVQGEGGGRLGGVGGRAAAAPPATEIMKSFGQNDHDSGNDT